MIVQHIEALETELAKFVESDADPKLAARTFADFLRTMRKTKSSIMPPNNEGNGPGRSF